MSIFKFFFHGDRTLSALIDPAGLRIPVRPQQTLLEAALAAGIPFPHDCRVGSCATCRCRLVEGETKALTDPAYTLSADELQAGYILACQSLLKSDIRILVDGLEASET